jgi:hypothetical protein
MQALVPRRRKSDWLVEADNLPRRVGPDAPVAPFLSQLVAQATPPEPTATEQVEARSASHAYATRAQSTNLRMPAGYRTTVVV